MNTLARALLVASIPTLAFCAYAPLQPDASGVIRMRADANGQLTSLAGKPVSSLRIQHDALGSMTSIDIETTPGMTVRGMISLCQTIAGLPVRVEIHYKAGNTPQGIRCGK